LRQAACALTKNLAAAHHNRRREHQEKENSKKEKLLPQAAKKGGKEKYSPIRGYKIPAVGGTQKNSSTRSLTVERKKKKA
jgi:hypothetical protein